MAVGSDFEEAIQKFDSSNFCHITPVPGFEKFFIAGKRSLKGDIKSWDSCDTA
jgi:hypothetical protein